MGGGDGGKEWWWWWPFIVKPSDTCFTTFQSSEQWQLVVVVGADGGRGRRLALMGD